MCHAFAQVILNKYVMTKTLSKIFFRNTDDVLKRMDILHSSKFDKLNPKQKEKIVKNPAAGQVY
jgi:hypothetical protein